MGLWVVEAPVIFLAWEACRAAVVSRVAILGVRCSVAGPFVCSVDAILMVAAGESFCSAMTLLQTSAGTMAFHPLERSCKTGGGDWIREKRSSDLRAWREGDSLARGDSSHMSSSACNQKRHATFERPGELPVDEML